MIVLAVVLWVCGIAPGSCLIPGEPWLPTLRERLERRQNEVLVERAEQQALDADRQRFLKRWLELKAKEKASEDADKYKRGDASETPITRLAKVITTGQETERPVYRHTESIIG
jgi:hypothetical protein